MIAFTGQAQRRSYYVSFQPGDLGVGLRYDQRDIYGSAAWGNYRFPSGSYIKNHVRLAGGYKIDAAKEIGSSVINHFSAGLVFHHYGTKDYYGFELNEQEALFPFSVEVGTGIRLNRIVGAVRFDVVKFEGVIDIGITFR